MATRPVFFATSTGATLVEVRLINFTWFPGMSTSRKQLSIDSLHESVREQCECTVLEISSKSRENLGLSLSAFNLGFQHRSISRQISVESAFQGSKVFEKGGPFHNLYNEDSRVAKKYFGDKSFGAIIGFNFFGQSWPAKPRTLFYNWLYLQSLRKSSDLSRQVSFFGAFTDIEFNPVRSLNSQAYAAALFVSLTRRGELEALLNNRSLFARRLEMQNEWFAGTPYEKHHPGDL